MFCIVVNFAVILFSSSAYGISNYGCMNEPEKCPPPNHCLDDGINGNCITQRYEWNEGLGGSRHSSTKHVQHVNSMNDNSLSKDEYQRLYTMVRHVQSYLHSKDMEFSDLSKTEINQLAGEMAHLFLKEKETKRKIRTQRLVSMLLDEKARLARRGIRLSQLTEEQKQVLIDKVVDKYMKSQGRIDQDQNIHPGNPLKKTVDSSVVEKNPPVKVHSPQEQSKRDPVPPPRSNSDDETGEVAEDGKSFLPSSDADTELEAASVGQAKAKMDDAVENQISKVEARKDEGTLQDSPTEDVVFEEKTKSNVDSSNDETYIVVIVVVAVLVVCIIVIVITICCMKSHRNKNKLLADVPFHSGKDYQALCRQHYASKSSETTEVKQPLVSTPKTRASNSTTPTRVFSPSTHQRQYNDTGSRTSSVSSWSEEPVTSSMDILTGHAVLNYMEDHLKNKDRLAQEWEGLCNYKAENVSTSVAQANPRKNRSQYAVPYDGNRVKLNVSGSALESDYINASFIIDNDPRWPVYIATQGPLSSTIHDFWQMVWEQGCTVIVMLTPSIEEGVAQCARYWPDELEGSTTYGNYEVNLVSEHVWRDDYLVRSLYLKNLNSGHTRTVTQFHFLSWPKNGIPTSSRQLLELRRKVSKCYRGNALSPAVVHCSDGCGRTGSYILIDLVLARILKGTSKEIDIAATLEHLRDQRAGGMVATKEQLKFALNCVADEVNAILKVIQ